MYTLETLWPANRTFEQQYRLNQTDVSIVNECVNVIEGNRGNQPLPGDIIEFTDEYGEYYNHAHLGRVNQKTGLTDIYLSPYTPFVSLNHELSESRCSFDCGGGPREEVKATALSFLGKRKKTFKVFGHHGAVPDGGLYFEAMVNSWEYIAPNQVFPGYSTRNWDRQYISCRSNPVEGCPYLYYGQGVAFKTREEYEFWKQTYHAVEFANYPVNQLVVFLYREVDKLVSREEWDRLDLPLDTRLVNGVDKTIHVKVACEVACDLSPRTMTAYRFTNTGYLKRAEYDQYERARGTLLESPGPDVKEELLYQGRSE